VVRTQMGSFFTDRSRRVIADGAEKRREESSLTEAGESSQMAPISVGK